MIMLQIMSFLVCTKLCISQAAGQAGFRGHGLLSLLPSFRARGRENPGAGHRGGTPVSLDLSRHNLGVQAQVAVAVFWLFFSGGGGASFRDGLRH